MISQPAVDRRVYFDKILNLKKEKIEKSDSSVKYCGRPRGRWLLFPCLPRWPVREVPALANSDSPTWLPNFRKERKRQKKEGVFETPLHFNTQSGEERRGDQPQPVVSCTPRIRAVLQSCPRRGSEFGVPSPQLKGEKQERSCLLTG